MSFDKENLTNAIFFLFLQVCRFIVANKHFLTDVQNLNLIRKENDGPLKRCTCIYYLT